ncbi:MAG: PilZ domain-containing protein [Planctomycetes bacterium]|nr:PilZ domain-containing protein [Planctomycetota bacterium]
MERRTYPRVSSECVVEWKPVDNDPLLETLGASQSGFVQNISGGGMCVRLDRTPEHGTMLALKLQLPGLPSGILALGKVCWIQPVEAGCDVGIEFWWVGWNDQGAQEAIRGFITDRLEP